VPLDNVVFWVFAPISVASAVAMLVVRNAVHAALFLVVNFFTLAVMYLLLDAPFLFAVQIVVYAGAIMVLFLFVIMLLGVDRGVDVKEQLVSQRWLAVLLAVGFVAELFFALRAGIGFATKAPEGFDVVNEAGNTQAVAEVLFRDYFFPFEVTSILLIIAAIATMVLAQRKARVVTQAELDARASEPVTDPVAPAPATRPEGGVTA
jgi:NADH-quinone oxidoreductase subunit J